MRFRACYGNGLMRQRARPLPMFILLMMIVSSLSIAMPASAAPKEDPICTSDAPAFDQALTANPNETFRNAPVSHVGQDVEIYKNSHHAAVLRVTGVEVRDHLGASKASGRFVIVCLRLRAHSSADRDFSLTPFVLGDANGANELSPDHDATVYSVVRLLGQKDISNVKSTQPTVMVSRQKGTRLAVVFDVPLNWPDVSNLYLADNSPTTKAFVVALGETTVGSAEQPTQPAAPTTEAVYTQAKISEARRLGDSAHIAVYGGDWRLVFEPSVEIRDHIGDYSVVPRRGQFLVIWFTQTTKENNFLPLGSFQLIASAKDGSDRTVTSIAREGTAALIITEYNFNPDLMDNGIPYRTGIVFDIASDQTHFELKYNLGGVTAYDSDNPVDITFDA